MIMTSKHTYEELEERILQLEEVESRQRKAERALEARILTLVRPLDDASDIAFEDLFNLDDIQRLQDEFSGATGVASIITHTDGTPITRPSNFCRFCKDIVRNTEKGRANCYKSDAMIGRMTAEGPTVQRCMSGGLWDAGAAISVDGKHIASWLMGQVRDKTQSEGKIREYAREIGADEDAAVEAFLKIPSMSRERLEQIAQLLFTLANQLSTTAYHNVQQARFISERKRIENELMRYHDHLEEMVEERTEELSRTNRELQEALANIKILKGLLPICSNCKKIRDDKGYWTQIECYIRDHSDAEFSHSLCPECLKKLYPGFYPEKNRGCESIREVPVGYEDHQRGNG